MNSSTSNEVHLCNTCKKPESALPAVLKRCAKCQKTFYCSRDCQKADWKSHKKDCSWNQGTKESSSSSDSSNPHSQRMENMFRVFCLGMATSDTRNIFSTPNKPGYLARLTEARAFAAVVDSYRLRKDDEYKLNGDASGLYADEDPLADFRHFLYQAEACDDVLPSWWNPEKRRMCERLALSDRWCNINCAVEKSDIIEHYGDRLMPMRLRMLAERATGSHLGI